MLEQHKVIANEPSVQSQGTGVWCINEAELRAVPLFQESYLDQAPDVVKAAYRKLHIDFESGRLASRGINENASKLSVLLDSSSNLQIAGLRPSDYLSSGINN